MLNLCELMSLRDSRNFSVEINWKFTIQIVWYNDENVQNLIEGRAPLSDFRFEAVERDNYRLLFKI